MSSVVDMVSIIIGIILAVIASSCFNLAIVYQKKGLKQGLTTGMEIKIEEGLKSIIKTFIKLIRNKAWLRGTLLGFIGWVPYIISIGLVGIVVTEPVMATGFILFVIAANRMLGEKVGIIELMAIVVVMIATVLIGLAGISDNFIDFHEFIPRLIPFLIISLIVSVSSLMIAKKTRGTKFEGLFIMFGGAILFALGGVATNILAQAIIQANETIQWYVLFEMVFGIFWFIFASSYIHLWVFLGFWMMAIFNLSSVPFYQGGFQKGKLLIMYPLLDSVALLLPIFAGLLVFKQTFANYIFFYIALALIVFGVIILSKYQVAIEKIQAPQTEELKS